MLTMYEVVGYTKTGTYCEVVEAESEEEAKKKGLPLLRALLTSCSIPKFRKIIVRKY